MKLNSHELKCWYQEARAAYLYFALSDAEAGTPRQLVFLELANEAKEQATLWATEARKSHLAVPEYTPDKSVKTLFWLMQKCGARPLKPLLALLKLRGLAMLAPSSRRNAEQTHLVFDLNDGLFALALLIIVLSSANASQSAIVLIGVAGLLAGAIATAVGEYLAAGESKALNPVLNLEHVELARIYHARGMAAQQASELATKVMADPDAEYDIEPETEKPVAETPKPAVQTPVSSSQVALRAFFAFVVGGVLPLAPYLLDVQRYPLLIAMVLSGVGVMLTGAVMASLSGRIPLWGAFRGLGLGFLTGLASAMVGGLFR